MPIPPAAHYISCPLQPHLLYTWLMAMLQFEEILYTISLLMPPELIRDDLLDSCCSGATKEGLLEPRPGTRDSLLKGVTWGTRDTNGISRPLLAAGQMSSPSLTELLHIYTSAYLIIYNQLEKLDAAKAA